MTESLAKIARDTVWWHEVILDLILFDWDELRLLGGFQQIPFLVLCLLFILCTLSGGDTRNCFPITCMCVFTVYYNTGGPNHSRPTHTETSEIHRNSPFQ